VGAGAAGRLDMEWNTVPMSGNSEGAAVRIHIGRTREGSR